MASHIVTPVLSGYIVLTSLDLCVATFIQNNNSISGQSTHTYLSHLYQHCLALSTRHSQQPLLDVSHWLTSVHTANEGEVCFQSKQLRLSAFRFELKIAVHTAVASTAPYGARMTLFQKRT
jgi:hypothetical protein